MLYSPVIEAYKNAKTFEEALELFEGMMQNIAAEFEESGDYTEKELEELDYESAAEKILNDFGVEPRHYRDYWEYKDLSADEKMLNDFG